MATAIDGIIPLRNIYDYSQIIDPIVSSKNMYYEISVTVPCKEVNGTPYKHDIFVVMGELLREDKTPRNGYGCRLRNSISSDKNYDIYTCTFNNDYGSTGINSFTIPYDNDFSSSLGYCRYTIGVGWNYQNKTLFYHLNPTQYGNQYGLQIDNVEFPTNTRLYVFLVDVDKASVDGMNTNISTAIITKWDQFKFPDVAEDYITRPTPVYKYASFPTETLITEYDFSHRDDEILDETLYTLIETDITENSSVIYLANNYDKGIDPTISINATTMMGMIKGTINFDMTGTNITYVNQIKALASDIFSYHMRINVYDINSDNFYLFNTIEDDITFSLIEVDTDPYKFTIEMISHALYPNEISIVKGEHYTLNAYSTLGYGGFSDQYLDAYLALRTAKIHTKLEFTVIGRYIN